MRSNLERRSLLCLLALALAWMPGMSAMAGNALAQVAESSASDGLSRRQDMENDPDLYLQLIVGMQEKNLYFASLAHLDVFDKRWPGNPRAALLRADALRETGYPDKATALYQTLLNGPQAAGAYHGLGILAARKGDTQAALSALERANQRDPINARILNDLGYIQLLNGQLEDARFNLHKATELDPRNTRAGGNLALLYLLENKPERAAGIMQWYQLPETHRKDIYSQAERLSASPKTARGADSQAQKTENSNSAPMNPRN